MIEKLKQKALLMNLRRTFVIFIVIGMLFAVTSGVLVYTNFNERFENIYSEAAGEDERQNFQNEIEHEDSEKEVWDMIDIESKDIVLVGALAVITLLLGVFYWILCMIWTYRKSTRLGTNNIFWLAAAAVFNLIAVAILYLYGYVKGMCSNCGHIKNRNDTFCSNCGTDTKQKCPKCGQVADEAAKYCTDCGSKLKQ